MTLRFLLPPGAPAEAGLAAGYVPVDRTPRRSPCWVLTNMVGGIDGTAAAGGRVASLSSERDHELFLHLRAVADVILVGAETVRRERYGPVRPTTDPAWNPDGRPPARIAVVSSSLALDPALPLFAGADPDRPPLVFTTTSSTTSVAAAGALPAEVISAGSGEVDLRAVLAELSRRGLRTVLCEGGPTLLGSLLAADLVDEYCLTVSPVCGGDPLPVVNTTTMSALRRFTLAHVIEEDSSLFLRYLAGPTEEAAA